MKNVIKFIDNSEIIKKQSKMIREGIKENIKLENEIQQCSDDVNRQHKEIQSIAMKGGTPSEMVGRLNENPVNRILKNNRKSKDTI